MWYLNIMWVMVNPFLICLAVPAMLIPVFAGWAKERCLERVFSGFSKNTRAMYRNRGWSPILLSSLQNKFNDLMIHTRYIKSKP